MGVQVQTRRGTATEHQTFTGAPGEVTVNTTNNSIHVHDGSTAGGAELLRADLSNVTTSTSALSIASVTTTGDASIGGNASVTGDFSVNTDRFTVDDITGDTSVYGDLAVGADFAVNTNKFTVASATGNTSVAGTLGVTGLLTATGGVSGDLTGNVTGQVSDISNHDTDSLSEGTTNLYYTDTRVGTYIGTIDTDSLAEGATNLYYTDARADARVSAATGVNLDLSNQTTDNLAEGSTNQYYTDTRVGTYIGTIDTDSLAEGVTNQYYTDARAQAAITGGTGVTVTSGQVAIGQAVGTTDNVTFNDLTVSGNLTVSGTTTTVNTETIELADNLILINSNATGAASENGGIEIERGDDTNVSLLWDETADKWTVGSETFVAGTFEGNLTGDVTGTVSSLSNQTTDNLSEGSTNLYYTDARVGTYLGTLDTDSISEGATNLYYTDARAQAAITAGTGVTVTAGEVAIGQAVATTDTPEFAGLTSSGNITPTTTGLSLGTAANPWGELFLSGSSLYIGTMKIHTASSKLYMNSNSAESYPVGSDVEIATGATAVTNPLAVAYAVALGG